LRFNQICRSKDYKGAAEFQRELGDLIPGKQYRTRFETICGLDVSFDKKSEAIYAAASIHSLTDLGQLEDATLRSTIDFPYVPGLLAFREGPVILELISKLQTPIDLLILDGQGLAHPRGAGIASMIGLLADLPSIGCAKTKLVGEYEEPGIEKGSRSDLSYRGNIVGAVLRSRSSVKPVFVSVGYEIDLERAVEIVLSSCQRYRLPEPIRRAHILANRLRQERNDRN
jgi:deoxyribonuclease V